SFFLCTPPPTSLLSSLSLHDALPISVFPFPDFLLQDPLPLSVLVDQDSNRPCHHQDQQQAPEKFQEFPIALLGNQLQKHLEKARSEEHTSELQSRFDLVCRLLLEKKK